MMWTRWILPGIVLSLPASVAAQTPEKPLPLPDAAIARYGSPRMRHPENVQRVLWLPDQKRVATRTPNHVFLWDLMTGHCLWQVPLPGGNEQLLEHTRQGHLIAQSGTEVRFLDESGKTRHVLRQAGKQQPWNYIVSDNGKRLIIVWREGPTIIYDLTEKGPIEPGRRISDNVIYAPQFTADGNTLICVTNKDVQTWDVQKLKPALTFKTDDNQTYYHSSRISPDGRTLMAVAGNRLRFWKVDQPKEWPKFQAKDTIDYSTVAFQHGFTQDSQSFVLATPNGGYRRWSMTTGELLESTDMPFKAQHVQWSPDGKQLAVIQNNALSIWDPRTGTSRGGAKGPPMISSRFVAADRVFSMGEDGSLHWWELKDGRLIKTLPRPKIANWEQAVISTDGRWWATLIDASKTTGGTNLWVGEFQQDKEHQPIKNLKTTIVSHLFSPDSKDLLTADGEGVWQFWDPKQGTLNRQFTAAVPKRLAYALDNRSIAAYLRDGGAGAIYDAQTGKRRGLSEPIHAKTEQVGDFCFSPSGQYLALAHGESLCVLSTVYGRVVLRRSVTPPAVGKQAVAFSPDERWLIVGDGRSPALHLYDLDAASSRTDYTPLTVQAHTGGVVELHLSPDKKYIVSTGHDGTALVWDTSKLLSARLAATPYKGPNLPEDRWTALRNVGGSDLSRLMVAMIHEPDRTVPLLAERLEPVRGPDAKTLDKWVKHLDSQQFVQRESAMKTLAELGELAEPALRAAMKQPNTVEFKLRARQLLQKLDQPESQPDRLRRFRSIEILERIGTPEARAILTRLAEGAAGARQTVEAAAALRRLSRH